MNKNFFLKDETLLDAGAVEQLRSYIEMKDLDGAYDFLKKLGYFGRAIPVEYEGGNANLAECCRLQSKLATIDFGLTVGLNMHLFTIGVMLEHHRRKSDIVWVMLEAIAQQKRIVASAFGEPGLAGSFLRSKCIGVRTNDGYKVSGIKMPCSLISRSDLFCFQFQFGDEVLVALLPTNVDGVTVKKTWNASGLQNSESDSLILENVMVPDNLIFSQSPVGRDPELIFTASLVWFSLLTTASYLGAAKHALTIAAQAMKSSSVAGTERKRSKIPVIQSSLGEKLAPILTLEASCIAIAEQEFSRKEIGNILEYALALKNEAVDACIKAASGAMELCGAGAFSANHPLPQLVSDMQAAYFHPPTRFVMRNYLARSLLGVEQTFDVYDLEAEL